jgi:IS30 family transposase
MVVFVLEVTDHQPGFEQIVFTNENTNGLLRDYFPKGVTLANYSLKHLLAVENELNQRPRMVLQDRCPADLFAALLASDSPSVLRR